MKNLILFWLTIIGIILIGFLLPIMIITSVNAEENTKICYKGQCIVKEAGHIYIVNCPDYEKYQKEKMQEIYDEINAKLDKVVEDYRQMRGLIDTFEKERREREIQQIQNILARPENHK